MLVLSRAQVLSGGGAETADGKDRMLAVAVSRSGLAMPVGGVFWLQLSKLKVNAAATMAVVVRTVGIRTSSRFRLCVRLAAKPAA